MDWIAVLEQVCQILLVPVLGAVATFLIALINAKKEEIKQNTDNALVKKYLDLVSNTVIACVSATNQTYVEAMKENNLFDEEAQKIAFQQTYNAVMSIISEDVKAYLEEIVGDFDEFITAKIEAEVNQQKPLL